MLDVGTGTGIWAIQLAKQYPRSTVVGTDLSLIQPSTRVRPVGGFAAASSTRWHLQSKHDADAQQRKTFRRIALSDAKMLRKHGASRTPST